MKFNVWFRKHQKKIFVVLGVVIMITWYMAGAVEDLLRGTLDRGGEIYGEKVSSAEIRSLTRKFQAWAPQEFSTGEMALAAAWEFKILLSEAQRLGLTASDAEVEEMLGYRFRGPQGMDRDGYREHIRNYNISPAEFDEFIRDLIATSKLQYLVINSVKVSEDQAWRWFIREEEKARARYAELRAPLLTELVTVDEDEMRRFHEQRMNVFPEDDPHGAGYRIPEKVKIEYVMVPFEAFEGDSVITERQVRTYYEENRENFTIRQEQPDHTVIMPLEDVRGRIEEELRDEEARKLAQDEIRRVDRRIAEQMDTVFGSMEVSEVDFDTLPDEFDVEYRVTDHFDERSIPPALRGADNFVNNAFGQSLSAIRLPRRPMESREGFFIFQLVDIEPPRASSFEEVAEQVEIDFRRAKARDLAKELIQSAQGEYRNVEDPEEAFDLAVEHVKARIDQLVEDAEAREVKLSRRSEFVRVRETSYFSRPQRSNGQLRHYGTGMPYNRGVFAQKAFEMEEGELGFVFEEFDSSAAYLLYITGREFPDVEQFLAKREEVLDNFAREKRAEAFRHWQRDMLARANPSETVRQLLVRRAGWGEVEGLKPK